MKVILTEKDKSSNEPYQLTLDTRPGTCHICFEDLDEERYSLIVEHFNKYWLRSDFHQRYEGQEQIGKGGFATVNVVERIEDRKLFAAKVVKKNRIAKEKEMTYFIHELKISRQLNHRLIVMVYEVHELDECFIIIQDFIDGVNLTQYLKLKRRLSEKIALHVIFQLLISVHYLHEKGIVHRDIKPANIMLKLVRDEKNIDFTNKYEIILIDFGLCADYNDHSPQSFLHDRSGTTGYLAPEVIKNSRPFYNEKVDLFSVGVVFVEM